jgi:hypothetical protein
MGLSSRAGGSLLAGWSIGCRTAGLGDSPEGTRERRSAHVPGLVFCDLAVMLAAGGRCVSDLRARADRSCLFGEAASVSTARRVALSVGESELAGIRAARAASRRTGMRYRFSGAELRDVDRPPVAAEGICAA